MTTHYLAYYRVSTQRQGRSGLGLEAQRAEVARLVAEEGACLVDEVTEVESGKDERNRPLLLEALERCRKDGTTLLVAKLCRLSRDAAFVLTLMKDSKVRFKVAAMPQADNFQLGIWALLNQQEREQISRRTREALATAKARGVKLGGTGGAHASLAGMNAARRRKAEEHKAAVRPLATHLRNQGMTLQAIADTLNATGSRTAAGCEWRPTQVKSLLKNPLSVRVPVAEAKKRRDSSFPTPRPALQATESQESHVFTLATRSRAGFFSSLLRECCDQGFG